MVSDTSRIPQAEVCDIDEAIVQPRAVNIRVFPRLVDKRDHCPDGIQPEYAEHHKLGDQQLVPVLGDRIPDVLGHR